MGSAVDIDKLTLKQLFEGMAQSFRPEEAKGLDTVIQYDISGEGGGSSTWSSENKGVYFVKGKWTIPG